LAAPGRQTGTKLGTLGNDPCFVEYEVRQQGQHGYLSGALLLRQPEFFNKHFGFVAKLD
jgi:hypothetical protein